jgi:hypothetical protein
MHHFGNVMKRTTASGRALKRVFRLGEYERRTGEGINFLVIADFC